jgi:hypothetical protein
VLFRVTLQYNQTINSCAIRIIWCCSVLPCSIINQSKAVFGLPGHVVTSTAPAPDPSIIKQK